MDLVGQLLGQTCGSREIHLLGQRNPGPDLHRCMIAWQHSDKPGQDSDDLWISIRRSTITLPRQTNMASDLHKGGLLGQLGIETGTTSRARSTSVRTTPL